MITSVIPRDPVYNNVNEVLYPGDKAHFDFALKQVKNVGGFFRRVADALTGFKSGTYSVSDQAGLVFKTLGDGFKVLGVISFPDLFKSTLKNVKNLVYDIPFGGEEHKARVWTDKALGTAGTAAGTCFAALDVLSVLSKVGVKVSCESTILKVGNVLKLQSLWVDARDAYKAHKHLKEIDGESAVGALNYINGLDSRERKLVGISNDYYLAAVGVLNDISLKDSPENNIKANILSENFKDKISQKRRYHAVASIVNVIGLATFAIPMVSGTSLVAIGALGFVELGLKSYNSNYKYKKMRDFKDPTKATEHLNIKKCYHRDLKTNCP